jgi:imidazolonepropionase-like amidohydrolase
MLTRRHIGLIAVAMLAACSPKTPPAASDAKVLKGFTLIDGTGRPAAANSALITEGGKITWVGPADRLKAPKGAEVVDLTGKYVTPGLIDLHVHIAIVKDLKQDIANYTEDQVKADLRQYASYGVTTVQVMGTDKDLIFPLRNAQRAGRPDMARIYTAGQGVVFEGGYGGVVGLNQKVTTPEQAVAAVNREADKGADLIKLWVDSELGTMPVMPPEVSKAVIDTAHKRGLRAIAHVFYLADAKRLLDQGVDGFAHSIRDQPIDDATLSAMKAKGTWQLAGTLARESAMFAFGAPSPLLQDPFFRAAASPASLELLASPERQKTIAANPHYKTDYPKFLAMAEANFKRELDAGINIGFGTDAGPPGRFPGFSEHNELELMVDAGATPLQALTAATGSAGKFLKADIGTVEAGKQADLLVLDADPLADIKNTRRINSVYLAGRQVPSVKP